MTILAIETSMAACSAALLLPGAAAPSQRFDAIGQGHAEALFPMIEAAMDEAGCSFADIARIAVTVGPGSFTGVRAGVAAARGLALATGRPLIGATSLEVMARGCLRRLGSKTSAAGFSVCHDARRGEVYLQRFDARACPLAEPRLLSLAEAAARLENGGLIVGSGAEILAAEALRRGIAITPAFADLLPEAGDLALIARSREPTAEPVSPLYLRPADAKPQMDKILARAGRD